MNRDDILPLLSRGWPSTKWEHATLLDFVCCAVGEARRVAAWVSWEGGWDVYYQDGWYCIEQTGDRITWSQLWNGKRSEMQSLKTWVEGV